MAPQLRLNRIPAPPDFTLTRCQSTIKNIVVDRDRGLKTLIYRFIDRTGSQARMVDFSRVEIFAAEYAADHVIGIKGAVPY